MMTIDGDYIEEKIRAMRHAGYEPHQIGYAIGLDVGKLIEEARWRKIAALKDVHYREVIDRIRAAHRSSDRTCIILMTAAFFIGGVFGWAL